jgi:hypothetical protein
MAVQVGERPDTAVRPAPVRFSSRPQRLVVAGGLVAAAAVHVPVAVAHLVQVPYLGYGFYLLVVLDAAAAGSVLVEDRLPVWVGLAGLNLFAVLAFVTSRAIGLPGAADDKGDWLNAAGIASVAAELLVVAVAALVLSRRAGLTRPTRST